MNYNRVNIVKLLKYVVDSIDSSKENNKNFLAEIAKQEMQKSEQEDRLSELTLKNIEIFNIADIKEEILSLEKRHRTLLTSQERVGLIRRVVA
jgi:hypothetical protein